MSQIFRTAALATALCAAAAQASGFYFGDNGTKALMQGGAFTAQADDLTAIQYNPAGLTQLDGTAFAIDVQLINHATSFTRLDPGFDPANPPKPLANEVGNNGGIFFLPFAGVSHNFDLKQGDWLKRVTVALGIYGPPSVGRYAYPEVKMDPTTGKYLDNPRKLSPQRYALLNNNIIILYPTLAASLQIHRRFSLGVSLQLVYSTFTFREAVYSGLSTPKGQTDETPIFDSVVNVNLTGKLTGTAIIGAMVTPIDRLSIGASVRPPLPITASGKLTIDRGEAATGLNTVVTGDQADLALTLPLEFRIGARFKPIDRLGINFDFVYLGWQSVQELLLTPKDISLTIGSGAATPVAPFHIPKNWHESLSFRLGGSFDLFKVLTLHAGFLYETSASPDQYVGIDFLHFDRFFITGGVSVHLWKFDLLAGFAGTPWVTKAIPNSLVTAGSTDSSVPGEVIGAGLYGSGGWIATIGLRGQFGGAPPPAPEPHEIPVLTPTPDPTPAPVAPAPAPAPAT